MAKKIKRKPVEEFRVIVKGQTWTAQETNEKLVKDLLNEGFNNVVADKGSAGYTISCEERIFTYSSREVAVAKVTRLLDAGVWFITFRRVIL